MATTILVAGPAENLGRAPVSSDGAPRNSEDAGDDDDDDDEEEDRTPWRTNIFTIYAKIFRVMLAKWRERMERASEQEKLEELARFILPSNEEWRQRVYYRLVDLQRERDLALAVDTMGMRKERDGGEAETKERKYWDWEPEKREYPPRPRSGNAADSSRLALSSAINDANGSMTEARVEPGWRVTDIVLAARVLQGDTPAPICKDEAETRRVFGLVYDVLRYKRILNQALRDVGFWYRYGEHAKRERTVWLLLYDMQGRKFSRRGEAAVVERRERAFSEAGIKDIEDALLETKTRLAASVSRLRIGGSALALDELLPSHLRTAEGVNWAEDGAALASGWVNTIKVSSKAEFIGEMAKLELRLCVDCNEIELDEDHYAFDPICPKVVNLHDRAREKLATSDLVASHGFIFLERSLCLGAATLAQTIRRGRLCGPIVLTHSIAPRHTAYLAGLIADIEDAGRLLAFGAGDQRQLYQRYLSELGLTDQQCRVFSERYASPPPSGELERATVVLCAPPCSYTGARDVVDLAVARGGDARLLESLTNIDVESEQPRALLSEQLATLRYALTRPNVQLLVYEAHSILPSETREMVDRVVLYANKMAAEKYSREHPPRRIKPRSKDSPSKVSRSGKSGKRAQSQEQKNDSRDESNKIERREDEDEEEEEEQEQEQEGTVQVSEKFDDPHSRRFCPDYPDARIDISEVPDSDIFEIGSPNDVYDGDSSRWFNEGCYLAIIRRKEMMQFNSLFMIKVAESKGLFGDPTKQPERAREQAPIVSPIAADVSDNLTRKSFKRPKIRVDRISAATHSSILRSDRARKKDKDREQSSCPRHLRRLNQDETFSVSRIFHSPVPGESSAMSDLPRPIASQRSTSKRLVFDEENLTNLANRITRVGDKGGWRNEDNRNSSTFSFGHGARALASATRKISRFDDSPRMPERERDKENSWEYKFIKRSSPDSLENKISRLYHPGGSLKFSRLELLKNPLARTSQYYQGFPYIFAGTGNAAAAAGLDDTLKK